MAAKVNADGQRILTIEELDREIRMTEIDLENETNLREASIARRDLDQLLRQRAKLIGWVPKLEKGSTGACILELAKERSEIDPELVAKSCGVRKTTAHQTLSVMSRQGMLKRVGYGKYSLARPDAAGAPEAIKR